MIKRLLAIILSLFIISTVLCAVTVSAETTLPVNIATDYVPGEITGNVITSENLTSGNYVGGWGGGAIGHVGGESAWEITTSAQVPDSVGNANSWGVLGRIVGDYDRASVFEAGENVVVSYQAKNSTGSPVMKVALYQNGKEPLYALEYPGVSDGTTVTNSEWKTYSHTLAIPESGFVGANNVILCVGIGYTGIQESRRGYWIKGGSVYVGKEYAYDIKVTASRETVMAGTSFTVDADILNQGGNVGGISQGVTWYALNADRTEAAEGFAITEGENGTATVAVAPSVAVGTYNLVAVADADADLVKGVSITVEEYVNIYEDYVAGEVTGNAITAENLASGNYVGGWGGGAIGTTGNDAAWQVTTSNQVPETVGNSGNWGVLGRIVGTYDRASVYEAGKNVIVSYQAKLDQGSPVMKVALYQAGKQPLYAKEYPGVSDGITVTNTDWQTYSHTLAIPATGFVGANNVNLCIGLAYTGVTEPRRGYWIKGGSVYVGQEYAHDITVTADKTEYVMGDVINVEAQILNQVGMSGGLLQNVTWQVMNTDRTVTYTEGFTITPGDDGTATVEIDPFLVAGGNYDIVAYSENYEMAKGVTITVPHKEILTSLMLSDFSENTVTATVNLKNTTTVPVNAVMIVFMANERNQITDIQTVPIIGITSADGKKTYTLPLTAADITKVVSAKAFLLDCGTQTLPTVLNSNLNELAPSLVVTK